MLKKVISSVVLVAWVLVISVYSTRDSEAASEAKPAAVSEIHIPVIAPLSGPAASSAGRAGQEGANLAVKLINDKGGVQGKKVVLDWLDDRAEASEAAVLSQKVADNKNYGVVVAHFSSDACFAAMPTYEKAGMAMVTPWASHAELTTRSSISFRMSASTAIYGRLNGDVIAGTLKAKKAAIILANAEYHKDHTKYLKERLAAKGVQVVKEETYMIGDSDFRPQLTNIVNARPDVIAIVGYPKETSLIINQARDMKYKGPMTIAPAAATQEVINLSGKNMTDTYMGAGGGTYTEVLKGKSTSNKTVAEFINAYRSEYKKEPPASGGWESQAYDVIRVIAMVVQKAGNDRKGILEGLKATRNFEGVNGRLFGDDRAQIPELGISKFDTASKQWAVIETIK
jgi:branched-chain amino acid transport system substrate-binding protein